MPAIYLDHAATTPVRPEVAAVMMGVLTESFGNPSSTHQFGRKVRKLMEEARQKTAGAIGAAAREIVFTSGGTESNNLAVLGTVRANRDKGRHLVTTAVEHHAVLDVFRQLATEGFEVTVLPVDEYGRVSVDQFRNALREDTILASVMHANNEIGTVNPLAGIGKICRERGVLLHTDAVQSVGKIPVNVEELQVDLLTVSGHKIYGPKGTGALYIRRGTAIDPLMRGGSQEKAIRPGTENVAGIVGLGKAIELAAGESAHESIRLARLRDKLIRNVLTSVPDARLNGHPTERLPHNVNVSFAGVEGETLIQGLDARGIAISAGSACTSGALEPSHVLLSLGVERSLALGTLRISLGRSTTDEDIDVVTEELKQIIQQLRSI
jgi:cysteine desulfurase